MQSLNFEKLRDSDGLAREEGEFLYGLVRAIRPITCVETGTHRGLSACYIGQALKDNGCGTLLTVDPYDIEAATDGFKEFGLSDVVRYEKKRGCDVRTEQKIDFLFIDGFHGINDVVEEIVALFPQLSENAIVVFHDCDKNNINDTQGVNAAVFHQRLATVWIPTKNRMRIYCNAKY